MLKNKLNSFKNRFKNDFRLDKLFMNVSLIIPIFLSLVFLISNNLLLGLLLIVSIIFVIRKYKGKHFVLYLLLIATLVRIAGIIVFNVPQTSDFAVLLEAARKFNFGDYSFSKSGYFAMWPYQTGFVLYEALILKIVNSEQFLKLLNISYEIGLTYFIYKTVKALVGETPARITAALYAVFPFSIYSATVISNHHLSALLGYLSIYFLLKNNKEDKLSNYIIAGILLGLSNVLRPEGIVIIFSYLLYRILKLTKKDIFKSKKWLITVVRCSIFVCFYSLVNMGVSTYLVKSNINEDGLKNNNPLWKFVLGTNPDTCGRYDTNDEIYLGDETKELEVIKDRINNPYKIGKLLLCKTNNFVLNGSLESSSGIYNDKKIKVLGLEVAYKTLEDLVSGVNKVIYGFMILGLIVGVYLKKKDILNSNLFYFYILFITNTLVYMLIEIQPRYTYFINVTVFILGSVVINKLLKLWDNRHKIIKIKN